MAMDIPWGSPEMLSKVREEVLMEPIDGEGEWVREKDIGGFEGD